MPALSPELLKPADHTPAHTSHIDLYPGLLHQVTCVEYLADRPRPVWSNRLPATLGMYSSSLTDNRFIPTGTHIHSKLNRQIAPLGPPTLYLALTHERERHHTLGIVLREQS